MKIVATEEFVRMPAGTIFTPCDAYGNPKDDYEIKVDAGETDEKGVHHYNGTLPVFPLATAPGHFEFFSYDGDSNDARGYEYFAVLEDADIDNVILLLQWAKGHCSDIELVKKVPGL
ncbi:hypothetical protein [Bacteroides sp.]|uniref:hypothetical protein n=1 Tax=Bacteroides sp. TaxID=29523 RepID=UPI0026137B17|nr:hypothetical protein [Bacteroides sp.]MDD3040058.1 hypothetical protein [Bacteroides sp.]